MRDATNLHWPEAPFGADQRPFGRRVDMLAAFTLGWATSAGTEAVPLSVASAYLRVRRHGDPVPVSADSLSIGFRVAVLEDMAELADLLALTDRALTRARRHAAIMAGHGLGEQLSRAMAWSRVPMRGAAGVLAAWSDRTVTERGVARMIDTAADVDSSRVGLDVTLDPPAAASGAGSPDPGEVARSQLTQCLAVGLAAAAHTGRYRWEGAFPVGQAIAQAAWDLLGPPQQPAQTSRLGPGVGPAPSTSA